MDVDKVWAEVLELELELVDMRRRLHRNPELSYKEYSTSKFVADTLRRYGVEVTEKLGGTDGTGPRIKYDADLCTSIRKGSGQCNPEGIRY
jgi:metal-dependent amidase/aminoacylase/carboxypeptidase family protein